MPGADYGTTINPNIAATMEPELNDRGTSKLECVRPNNNNDLPVHSLFPKNVAEFVELAKTDPTPAGPALSLRNFGREEEVVGGCKSCKRPRRNFMYLFFFSFLHQFFSVLNCGGLVYGQDSPGAVGRKGPKTGPFGCGGSVCDQVM